MEYNRFGTDLMITGVFTDDGHRWLRVENPVEEWEELAGGWTFIIDLCRGGSYYRASDGRIAMDKTSC